MASHRIWAPWRLEYIKGDKTAECIFCTKPREDEDAHNFIVHRGARSFVILNTFPYTNGHLMIAPYEHVAGLQELDDETMLELMRLTRRALRALDAAYRPEGYNVGLNLGIVAGAGFADHVHLHVVPRWAGDTNFMPVLGDTRVLPERLEDSYRSLHEAFRAAGDGPAEQGTGGTAVAGGPGGDS